MTDVVVHISGMDCGACAVRIVRALQGLPGLREVSVSDTAGCACLTYDEMAVDLGEIARRVQRAGFDVPVGMAELRCPGADAGAEARLRAVFGVRSVARAGDTFTVTLWPVGTDAAALPAVLGPGTELMAQHGGEETLQGRARQRLARWLGLGVLLTALMLWRPPVFVQLVLAAAVLFGVGAALWRSTWRALRGGSLGPDAPGLLAALILFAYSAYAAFAGLQPCFSALCGIACALLAGKCAAQLVRGTLAAPVQRLRHLRPRTATVVRDGVQAQTDAGTLTPQDVVHILPGERIPVDGVVLAGTSAVNEAALTGESIPADKAPGASVSAATVNQSGFLKCRATRVGEDTTLSQIIQMVSDAAATKAPIAKIADKVSGVFVPSVMGIALVTFVVWMLLGRTVGYALARGISVLVISCPCALGLATPVAIMVGSGMGAKNGILFKTAASLEETGRIQIVALDKTGTITSGDPTVTDICPAPGVTEGELLRLACALERRSEHPLAKAVLRRAEADGLTAAEVADFQVLPGNGLRAVLDGQPLCGGNADFLRTVAEISAPMQTQAEALSEAGKTPLFFARGGKLLGIIAVADVLKPDSPQAVRELRNMGIRVVMITGDNARTAKAIGAQAGVDEVIAGVLPDGKEREIRRLSARGKVAMVGDGINDAPALTRADIGIAIGAGTDVAIDAADVVLVNSRLSDVPAAIRLSRATLRNIHENLFWAFFYNTIGIPIAAGVFVPLGLTLNPMFGAAAMSLSSFCVVTNALRLNLFRLRDTRHDHKRANHLKEAHEIKEETTMKKTISIEGMMCGHCEATVKKALEALPEVTEAEVSHTAGTAVVTLSAPVDDAVLKRTVEAKDYTVTGIA